MNAKDLEGHCFSAAGREFPNADTLRQINAELEECKAKLEVARSPGPDVSRLVEAAREVLTQYRPGGMYIDCLANDLEHAIAEHEAARTPGSDVSRLLRAVKVIGPHVDRVIEYSMPGDVPGVWLRREWLVELSAAIAEHEAAAKGGDS